MKEQTLIVIKPDGVERNLIGEIISRYEKGGLRIAAMKMLGVSESLIKKHYPEKEEYLLSLAEKGKKAGDPFASKDPHGYGMFIVTGMRKYMTSGPVVAMILEGENAIKKAREITGYTDPSAAEKGTIRGDLGNDNILQANKERRPVYNLIHASGNKEEAETEIKLWFSEIIPTKILFDTNIYGWAVEDKSVGDLVSKLINEKNDGRLLILGFGTIKKELEKNPHKPTRMETLKLYNSAINNALEINQNVKILAESYFKACINAKIKITIEDCEIIAAAVVNRLDYIVTNNRRTMNNSETKKILENINHENNFKMPRIIDSKEAFTTFAS
ncbi:MAG: hypothetical protein HYW26_04205 [Candidatus Aenigmarchaeota archaeon]|nr:hypothetical protein [Candidatus Aenigmarchaeota archaeon]